MRRKGPGQAMTETEKGREREFLHQMAEGTSCAALKPHILPGRQDSALLVRKY